MILVTTSCVASVPWKNGGGVTRELLRLPPTGDDWTLRVSVAHITADGPFSLFDGVSRWFVVLAGNGVRLTWPGRALDVHAGAAPLQFDGGDAPGCALLAGATQDLNVMVRSDRADARVEAATWLDEADPGSCPGFGFFALQPSTLHGASAAPVHMPALSLAWCAAPFRATRGWSLRPAPHAEPGQEHALPGYWIRLLPPTR